MGSASQSELDQETATTAIQNIDTESPATAPAAPALQPANESERIAIQQAQNVVNTDNSQR